MMDTAIDLARHSKEPCRHGCIIAKRSRAIGYGWNKGKTHPAAVSCYSQCIHAELSAMIGVNRDQLIGADLFVARVKRSEGEPLGMSKPCPHCMKMIIAAKIRRIYFTNETGQVEMIKT
jgi:deoxycytidylate deaminase